MLFCTLRFWWRGWIEDIYINTKFHFTFQFFDWVKPLGATGMYIVFGLIALSSLCIALGLLYRIATIIFFIAFTYVELIDSTVYLNHYYFISLIAFILIWLPAHKNYSLDVLLRPSAKQNQVAVWTIDILRFQLAVVYIFAGLAKLNTDWLIHAEPMRTWLPGTSYLPIVGKWMYKEWMAYLFSWFGAAYDLFIVFFLLNKKTRPYAYLVVIVFHIATAIFFPGIGMFPYIMIVCSLVFFSAGFHNRWLGLLPFFKTKTAAAPLATAKNNKTSKAIVWGIAIYMLIQLLLPLRYLLYPGNLFWHEQGYRFSWRVMLMEKAGAAYFTVKDKSGTQKYEVNNAAFLTPLQEKMMSTQPDMILRYAHFIAEKYKAKGIATPQVFAEIFVTLNGRPSQLFIDSTVDLAKENLSVKKYKWVVDEK